MERLVDELLRRDDADELLTTVFESGYAAAVLARSTDSDELIALREAVADSAKRTALAERFAAPMAGREGGRPSYAAGNLLLPSLLAPILMTWIASIGIAATAGIVYVSAVIAATPCGGAHRNPGEESPSEGGLWIPL